MSSQVAVRRRMLILALALPLLIAGCSDDGTPTDPGDDEPPANTPELPTVANPNDELPATSGMLDVEDAALGNFTPKVTAASPLVDTLNEAALALAFRMVPGYCRVV